MNMESSGNAQGNRGAYAPVTVAISPGDENNVPTKPSARQQGVCSRSRMRVLLIVLAVVVAVIVLIIIIAVVSKKGSSAADVMLTTMAQSAAPDMTSSSLSSRLKHMTTVSPTTTPSPPRPGSFEASLVVDSPFQTSYDDSFAPEYESFVNGFINATAELYMADAAVSALFDRAEVKHLLSRNSGTNVDVVFTVFVHAIERGAREYLETAMDPLPSTRLAPFNVLSAAIQLERVAGTTTTNPVQ